MTRDAMSEHELAGELLRRMGGTQQINQCWKVSEN